MGGSNSTDTNNSSQPQHTKQPQKVYNMLDDTKGEEDCKIDEDIFKKHESQIKTKLEEMKKNPSMSSWLSVFSLTTSCDPKSFDSLEKNIDTVQSLHKFYQRLEDVGFGNEQKFGGMLHQVLNLFHKQWKLLDETLRTLKKLSVECEDCNWAIDDWQFEMKKIHPNSNEIAKNLKILQNWSNNSKHLRTLVESWMKFQEEAKILEIDWKGQVPNMRKTIEAKYRTQLQSKMNGFTWSMVGGMLGVETSEFRLAFGCIAVGCIGILSGLLLGGTFIAAYEKSVFTVKKLIQERENILLFIDTITKELNKCSIDSMKIQVELQRLRDELETQEAITKMIEKRNPTNHEGNSSWDGIYKKLTEIKSSLQIFQVNCDRISKIIVKKQREIAGLKD